MRAFIAVLAMTIGSAAFQLTILAGKLNKLTWVAPYLWVACGLFWVLWVVTHKNVKAFVGHVLAFRISEDGALNKTLTAKKLTIHSAVYGTGPTNDADVTRCVENAVRDALVIPVDNNFLGCDPAPNQPKRLSLEYSYGNQVRIPVSAPESSRLILPEDSRIAGLTKGLATMKDAARSATEAQRYIEGALSESENRNRDLEGKLSARPDVPLSVLQTDALRLSSELLHFLKSLGPMPTPKYTKEDIDKMAGSQVEKLVKAEDRDFAEACEYYSGDGTWFVQTANPFNNNITARWNRLLPWFQKVASRYALEFKDKVEKMRNRLAVEGVAPHVLLLPIEGRDGEKNIRAIAAALWEVAYKIGEKTAC